LRTFPIISGGPAAAEGHQVIGLIAEHYMTADALAKVRQRAT
jgi:hypothetical protein